MTHCAAIVAVISALSLQHGAAVKVTPEQAAARRQVTASGIAGGGASAAVLSWPEYKRTFVKVYPDAPTEARAKAAFAANVRQIHAINTAADVDGGADAVRAGVNDFTDLSYEQWRTTLMSGREVAEAQQGWAQLPQARVPAPGEADPTPINWLAKGAVTPVKNQGSCGGCWSFSTTGALEGAYQIATGSLRSLSEQQLIDCSTTFGNQGCGGGSMRMAFDYILANKGIDSEDDYPYSASGPNQCWKAAENRTVAQLSKFTAVKTGSEPSLVAAAALGPVSVAIEADHPVFQHYKSGILANASGCGTKLDHGVLLVGFTADYYIVKNSWGPTWGEKGYIRMKRNVNDPSVNATKSGICGIAQQASYPTVAKGTPLPIPPKTDPKTRPVLPCNCTAGCTHSCNAFGMTCCGNGHDCDCSTLSACPQCGPKAPPPYAACTKGCQPATKDKLNCLSTQGVPGHICSPGCPDGKTCPPVTGLPGVTAKPYCDYCMTGAESLARYRNFSWGGANPEKPTQCALICTASSQSKAGPFKQDGCPGGSTCKPFSMDPDPCETTHVDLPCSKTKSCGMCTYP